MKRYDRYNQYDRRDQYDQYERNDRRDQYDQYDENSPYDEYESYSRFPFTNKEKTGLILLAVLTLFLIIFVTVKDVKKEKTADTQKNSKKAEKVEKIEQNSEVDVINNTTATEAQQSTTEVANKTPEIWQLTLVNQTHPTPDDWKLNLTTLNCGEQVDERILPDLQEMFDTMREQDMDPIVSSGYRDHEKQQEMMDKKINEFIGDGLSEEEAKAEAGRWVAKPGTSEHHLGLAIDVVADVSREDYDDNESDIAVYEWLAEHSYEYGFIQRYPEGKEEITGVRYEPWHFRYVGRDYAKKIYQSGLTMEEYLEKYPEGN